VVAIVLSYMDIKKLKLEKFSNIKTVNMPSEFDGLFNNSDVSIEVILYYIDSKNDVSEFIKLVKSSNLPKENRTILIYKKGRKDGINRDLIAAPFREGEEKDNFKMRAPMLCSLSSQYSAFVLSYEG